MSTPTLTETVTNGVNGTKIFEVDGRYYALDGQIDCSQPHAESEVKSRAWRWDRNLDDLRKNVRFALGL